MQSASADVLKKHGIHLTRTRVLMIDAFLHSKGSLDLHYFLYRFPVPLERTTVFRTLNLFINRKLIYAVEIKSGHSYILLGKENREETAVYSSLICDDCQKVIPVETITPPIIKIPGDFDKREIQINVHGNCPACAQRQSALKKTMI